MNTLVQGYLAPTNDFQLNCHSNSMFPQENHVSGYNPNLDFDEFSHLTNVSQSSSEGANGSFQSDELSSPEGEIFKETDHSDAVLKFISDMLMEEEDLENKPCMLNECLALQATEKSLFNVLNNNLDQNPYSPNDHFAQTSSINSNESNSNPCTYTSLPNFGSNLNSGASIEEISNFLLNDDYSENVEVKVKKNRYRDEDSDFTDEMRSNKQSANYVSEPEPFEMYDKVLLCSNLAPFQGEVKKKVQNTRGRPRGGRTNQGGNNNTVIKEVVDLRSLLMQTAQAVASYDTRTVTELLTKIRRHSSPHGDGTERLAHYLANALEARLAGTGTGAYFISTRKSAAEMLKAYRTFLTACPFRKMSNVMANKTIKKLAVGRPTLHIIDFGILYGFQWPCLIQTLSERPEGPPMLRITGIEFPQSGFRPAERVEDTGRRLAKYCERFGVPFEYFAIAQKWETIKLEDLKIVPGELLVVNCVHRLQNVLDETVISNSPRDVVLSLIREMNPDMFIHGAVNGTYNIPFFVTRFREALFHFSSLFDMFEASLPREDENRVLFEQEVFGNDAMNVIACEGTERIDRPETYKQWQGRHVRAGFKQVGMDRELMKYVRNKVKSEYHKDFSVDEDGKWMLHGWKGRVIYAISFWKPSHK